jgi:glycogen debranching enzyme
MPDSILSVLDGTTFVVGDGHGDLRADEGREHGFFSDDTRFVSRWVLTVSHAVMKPGDPGATPMQLLGLDQSHHFSAQFFLTPTVGPQDEAPSSILRHRLVDHVWMEEVTVVNHRHERRPLTVTLDVDADFADLFEVKESVGAPRSVDAWTDDHKLVLSYERDGFSRAVTIDSSREASVSRHGFVFNLDLAPGERWSVTFTVTPVSKQPGVIFPERVARGSIAQIEASKTSELARWLAGTPALRADDPALTRTYRASLTDLAALRIHPDLSDGATLPAAGLPWFMALFGRDSLITSFQALPYLPELAATTLRVLGAAQATSRDDFQEREPGKILHELRFGELTARGERPHSPYYGSADATPLFLILLDEYHRWTGDDALVRSLEPNARAALDWINDSGDSDGDGYVEYFRRNVTSGLINQCWKDSWNSMQFVDGTLAQGPIATAEIQGYVYDARVRSARLAREVWHDMALAERLEAQAAALRFDFRRDFWMPERQCHALALDGEKRQVDSLTSNIGHLLWSGIVDEEEATATAAKLFGQSLNSGWGVRTLGASEAGYNPLGYHTGTVWPHENSLIAAGLARYGHRDLAVEIAASILRAAPYFEHRLPEVFAGYPASETIVPVAFPTASRPQSWAAGAPLLMLTTLLDLQPESREVQVDLEHGFGEVSLTQVDGPTVRVG